MTLATLQGDSPMNRPGAAPTVQIDNEHVRVTEWRFPPGDETGWHRHGMPYVVVHQTTGPPLLDTPDGQVHSSLRTGLPSYRPMRLAPKPDNLPTPKPALDRL